MPGWTLHRLNFKPDGTVKITYRKKATTWKFTVFLN
jgi:hypothetical protein